MCIIVGSITLRAGWAGGYGRVSITNDFILTAPSAAAPPPTYVSKYMYFMFTFVYALCVYRYMLFRFIHL
jgi:hypothetical protein